MQHCIIYKSFAVSWVFGLLMIISITAIADSNNYQYSLQLTGGQSNPWALPQTAENPRDFQQPLKYRNQQYQDGSISRQNQGRYSQNRTYQSNRFVTPEFLESLKRQQSQLQMMPENGRYLQSAPRQSKPQRPESSLPGSGSFGYPLYGMDYVDPLYDTPAVTPWSPWDIGSDTW